jgi:hypothetical protein
MEGLEEYRRTQFLKYQLRCQDAESQREKTLRAEEEENTRLLQEAERVRQCYDTVVVCVEQAIMQVKVATTLQTVVNVVQAMHQTLQGLCETWSKVPDNDLLKAAVMQLFQCINDNRNIQVRITETEQLSASTYIQETMRDVLMSTGILEKGDDVLCLEYDMDCSNDEELARTLANRFDTEEEEAEE